MNDLKQTARTTLERRANRGTYDRSTINGILDDGLICHIGVVVDGAPRVLPTAYVRHEDCLYVHGATTNATFKSMIAGADLCITVTLLDGLVLARSAMHHSLNYRSVMLYGKANEVVDADLKQRVLDALIERMLPGRLAEVRRASEAEIRATTVIAIPLLEGSAKVRSGPPVDAARDLERATWAGVVPLRLQLDQPEPDPGLAPDIPMSNAVLRCRRRDGRKGWNA